AGDGHDHWSGTTGADGRESRPGSSQSRTEFPGHGEDGRQPDFNPAADDARQQDDGAGASQEMRLDEAGCDADAAAVILETWTSRPFGASDPLRSTAPSAPTFTPTCF